MGNSTNAIMRHGVQCDTPECGYRVEFLTFEEYVPYVNKPCPQCGANLLTEKDYELAEQFHKLSTDEDFAKEFELKRQVIELPKQISDLVEKLQEADVQSLIRVEFVNGSPKMTSESPEVQNIIDAIDEAIKSEKEKFDRAVNLAQNN